MVSQIQSGQADVVYLTPHAYTSKQPSPKSSYVFSIVRPVLNNGTIIGVIKADVKSSLLETIFDIQEMQGYALYVFDRDTGEAVYVPEGADTLPLTRFQDSVRAGTEATPIRSAARTVWSSIRPLRLHPGRSSASSGRIRSYRAFYRSETVCC